MGTRSQTHAKCAQKAINASRLVFSSTSIGWLAMYCCHCRLSSPILRGKGIDVVLMRWNQRRVSVYAGKQTQFFSASTLALEYGPIQTAYSDSALPLSTFDDLWSTQL